MIDKQTFTREHFDILRKNKVVNPPILERAIFALGLLEALRKVGMDFIFKGGSSLMLLLSKPMRLSTDVDILVEPGYDVDEYILKASTIFPFLRKEESIRKTNKNIGKRHFRFYFKSILNPDDELSILLDVVYERNPYPSLVEKEIANNLLVNSGEPLKVKMPSVDSIIGDKLNAFAPHTTGVNFFNSDFTNDKRLEVIKQFYDVATLFDYINDYNVIRSSYLSVNENELKFRDLSIGYKECLLDSYSSALTILLRGENGDKDYPNYLEGMRRIVGHIYGENFSSEVARLHAPKVMFLAACLYCDADPKSVSFDNVQIPKSPYYKKISALGKAPRTKKAYDLAVAAINSMEKMNL